jgi:pyruvate kinase
VPLRRTKILATLGPSTDPPGRLDELVAAGLDGGRINCAHDTAESWLRRGDALREAAERAGRPLALLFDLAGPKMRLGTDVRARQVGRGEDVLFAAGADVPADAVTVGWPDLADAVTTGRSEIVIGDGTPRLTVLDADRGRGLVRARCDRPGTIGPRKGIFVTYVATPTSTLSDQDRADLAVAAEADADFVALSFVRSEQDVRRLRGALDELRCDARVIAKIEKIEAFEALEEIVDVSDGIMVARGDLGVEAGVARVPMMQKAVISRTGTDGKLVITATQMLESMTTQPEPTRAEAADVANAILDGTSAVMLSGETTIGRYPVESVAAMADIAIEAETGFPFSLDVRAPVQSRPEAVMQAAVHLAQQVSAVALVVSTVSGGAARAAAKYRPRLPVIALSESPQVRRRLALEWGVIPGSLPPRARTLEQHRHDMITCARDLAGLRPGDVIVLAYGPAEAGPSETCYLAVREVY